MKKNMNIKLHIITITVIILFLSCDISSVDNSVNQDFYSISGTITFPELLESKNILIYLDDDTDGDNGIITQLSDTASGNSYNYTINNISAGNYYILAVVYINSISGAPQTGDLLGAHGITALSQWPDSTSKVAVNSDLSNLDFITFTIPSNSVSGEETEDDLESNTIDINTIMGTWENITVINETTYTTTWTFTEDQVIEIRTSSGQYSVDSGVKYHLTIDEQYITLEGYEVYDKYFINPGWLTYEEFIELSESDPGSWGFRTMTLSWSVIGDVLTLNTDEGHEFIFTKG